MKPQATPRAFSWYAQLEMSRLYWMLVIGSLQLTACQRSPIGSAPEPAASPVITTSHATTSTSPPTCIVPMAESPASAAKPASQCPAAPTAAAPLRHGSVKFLGGDQSTLDVELALSADEQRRGLMYRTELAAQAGMLFSWSTEQVRSFWMQNTCIPLDMLFITADGTIAGILEQVPVLDEQERSIPCRVAHVLEVNAGYCRAHGIAPGQRVRIRTP
jgi:uncharacterized protein